MSDQESVDTSLTYDITSVFSFKSINECTWTNVELQRKAMELILSMKNLIVDKGGSETPVEYYTALLGFLRNTEVDNITMEACGYLLKALLLKDISIAMLQHTTNDMTRIVKMMLSDEHGKNEQIVRYALSCLAKVLSVQSNESWSRDYIRDLYRTLFAYSTDLRSAINKVSRQGILMIFQKKSSKKPLNVTHPLVLETSRILENSIRRKNSLHGKSFECKDLIEDDKLSLFLKTLSNLMLSKCLSPDCLTRYAKILIQCLLSMQIIKIQEDILKIFSDLFRSHSLAPELVARSISALFTYINNISGREGNKYRSIPPLSVSQIWLEAAMVGVESLILNAEKSFTESESKLLRNCRDTGLHHCRALVQLCADWLLQSDDMTVLDFVFQKLSKLCSGGLVTTEEKIDYLDPNEYDDADRWLSCWFELIGRHLHVQNDRLWTQVLELTCHLVSRSRGKCPLLFQSVLLILPNIAELRDSFESSISKIGLLENCKVSEEEKRLKQAIESLISRLIKLYGVQLVIDRLPLFSLMNNDEQLSGRSWLVPLLQSAVESVSLDSFRTIILPCIRFLSLRINNLQTSFTNPVTSSAVITLGLLRHQFWSCLPSFARKVVPGGLRAAAENPLITEQQPEPSVVYGENTTLFELMLSLLKTNEQSNLEGIVLSALHNCITTATDREEMISIMTSALMFPRLLNYCFNLYVKGSLEIKQRIKILLAHYLPLFFAGQFDGSVDHIITNRLVHMDTQHPTEEQLACVDLLIIIGPHLTVNRIEILTDYVQQFLDNATTNNQLQKRIYRYFEQITSSNTQSSNEYTKNNLLCILDRFKRWQEVKSDSWKCRIKSLNNMRKLMNSYQEISRFMNDFFSEIIICLNEKNKKTRAVAGLLLVEGIIGCNDFSDNAEETLSNCLSGMVHRLITCFRDKMNDISQDAIEFKGALAKALFLIVSEYRLSRVVTRQQLLDVLAVVTDVLRGYDSRTQTRTIVNFALDILNGLLKKKTNNFGRLALDDIGNCLHAADNSLREKVRMPIKRILKKMIKLWDVESVKKAVPVELAHVVRNINKAMNRNNRNNQSKSDGESVATSWAGASDAGTMKNPNIKNIADLLEDSDDEDEDLKTTKTGMSIASSKSKISVVSKASALRKQKKRKIDEANAMLYLEEQPGEVIDISDPSSMLSRMRISKIARVGETQNDSQKKNNITDKRGFHFDNTGRLVIENLDDVKEKHVSKTYDNKTTFKKERFQKPLQSNVNVVGSQSLPKKKGTYGDLKRHQTDPFAYTDMKELLRTNTLKASAKERRVWLKAARQASIKKKKVSNIK